MTSPKGVASIYYDEHGRYLRFEQDLGKISKMTDRDLKTGDGNQLENARCRGRARGLIAIWEEMGEGRNRIWMSVGQTPGHGRAATLALMSEMVAQNATRTPGPQSQLMGRGFVGVMNNITNPFPMSMGRARSRKPRPHPSGEAPRHPLNSWPQCLCHCRHPLEDIHPNPSSSKSEDSTSCPPSLESITGPKSGYEASCSASSTE